MHRSLDRAIIRIPLLDAGKLKALRIADLSEEKIRETISLLCTQEVLAAIYISSAEYAELLEDVIGSKAAFSYDKLMEIWLSFVKYYSRMCSRSTPYGLMASVGVIKFGDCSKIATGFVERVHTQLDNALVKACAELLSKSKHFSKALSYFPNPSHYQHGSTLKYIEETKSEGDKVFALSKVENNIVIKALLRHASQGMTQCDLLGRISEEFGHIFDPADLSGLIGELIENKILINELSSSCTGETLFTKLVSCIRAFDQLDEQERKILRLDEALKLNAAPQNTLYMRGLKMIEHKVGSVGLVRDRNSPIFHVNLIRSFSQSFISSSISEKVLKTVELVAALTKPFQLPTLEDFKARFVQRFENQFIPLVEVLDEEIGIGYPVGNIRNKNADGTFDDVRLPGGASSDAGLKDFSGFYAYLFNSVFDGKAHDRSVLNLTTEELKQFALEGPLLPKSFSIFCTLLASGAEDINKGQYQLYISNNSVTSAISPINRFSVSDPEIESLCRDIVAGEQEIFSGKIVAEVIHSPNPRVENITFRKVTRDWEIPIETLSSLPQERQVMISDILLNVVNGRIKLIRRADGKEIIPKISNFHAFDKPGSLPFYHFFGDLQTQDQQNNLVWQWGPLNKLNFLPRVVLDGDVILSPAIWTVEMEEGFFTGAGLHQKLLDALHARGLSRLVMLRQNGDNLLQLDICDISCLQILIREFKKYKRLIFQECLNSPENLPFRDNDDNRYSHDIVIPYLETVPSKAESPGRFVLRKRSTEIRSFFPGEDFLYIKIYCSKNTAQKLLIESIAPLFSKISSTSRSMFFIRYEDPDFHLRLRIRAEDNHELMPKVHQLLKKYIVRKLIYRVVVDTYNRELDRYALVDYDKTEQVFTYDSKAILTIMRFLEKTDSEGLTWIVAMKIIYTYMQIFGMSDKEMDLFCDHVKQDFFGEMKLRNKEFLKSLNLKFKNSFKQIQAIFSDQEPRMSPISDALDELRHEVLAILSTNELKILRKSRLQCSSYIHMSLNRLFASDERLKEAMCYDLLHKYLTTLRKYQLDAQ